MRRHNLHDPILKDRNVIKLIKLRKLYHCGLVINIFVIDGCLRGREVLATTIKTHEHPPIPISIPENVN